MAFQLPRYDISFCKIVVELGDSGKNLAQIAKELGVPRSVLMKWAQENEEFRYALELSQDYALSFWSDKAEGGLYDPTFRSDVFAKQMSMMFPKEYRGEVPDSFAQSDPSKVSPIKELAALLEPRNTEGTPLSEAIPAGNA